MIFIPFDKFELYEKLKIPNTDFVTKILLDLKQNFFATHKLESLSEEDIITAINEKFSKYQIGFAPVYELSPQIRNMATKEFANLGVAGALTGLDGSIVIIIMPKFFTNLDSMYDNRLFKNFTSVISSLIGHELIHREQLEKMDPKYVEELATTTKTPVSMGGTMYPFEYYSSEREIAAFANQAIDDLIRHGFTRKTIEDFIKKPTDWVGTDFDRWATEKNFKKFSMPYIVYYLLFSEAEPTIWKKFEKQLHYFLDKIKK